MDTVSTDNIAQDPSAVASRIQEAGARLLEAAKASYAFDTPREGVVDPSGERGPLLQLKATDLGRVRELLSREGKPLGFRPLHGGSGQGPAPSQSFSLTADLPRPHLLRSLRAIHEEGERGLGRGHPYPLAIALGFLRWVDGEGDSGTARRSPLLLAPVRLEESDEGEFYLEGMGRPAVRNATLAHVLRKEHWIELPELQPGIPVPDYLESVRGAIGERPGWSVDSDSAVLASFEKSALLHYLDLDPVAWRDGSTPSDHEIVQSLLGGLIYTSPAQDLPPLELEDSPFDSSPFEGIEGPGVADHLLDDQTPGHVLDADGHQALGIEEIRLGLDLILSGQPGTGRTQTVANVVAGAVRDGQRVLVVSEDARDLDDLAERLDQADLGSLCLRLYGREGRRKALLRSVAETLDGPDPRPAPAGDTIQRLRSTQRRLNAHAQQMHYAHSFAGISAYEISGWMARLLARGRRPLDVALGAAREWDKAFLSNATDHLARLARHVATMGSPRIHPWRGVGGRPSTTDEEAPDRPCPEEVRDRVARFHERLTDWERRVRRLAAQLCVRTRGIGDVAYMAAMAGQILKAPDVDRKAIRSPVWRRRRGEIETLVRNGQRLEDARDQIDPVLISAAWKEDLSEVRQILKAQGDAPLRWASSAYRRARARLKGLAQNQPPMSTTEQVRLLDTLDRGQEALRQIEDQDELGKEAFGRHWRGADSEWAHLSSIIHWVAGAVSPLSEDVPGALARAVDPKGLARLAADAETGTETITSGFAELMEALDVDLASAFGAESLEQVPLAALKERLDDWARRPEAHQEWTTYLAWDREARDLGLDPLADGLADGSLDPDHAVDVFHLTYLQELTTQLHSELPDLAGFDAETQEALQFMFVELDAGLIAQNQRRTQAVHRAGLPVRSQAGEIGVLLSQIEAPRQDQEDEPLPSDPLTRNEILRQAGRAVQAIKPVFLMSPATVAELLEPGHLSFDLVVLESAEEMAVDRALGAIARGRQLVLVGLDGPGVGDGDGDPFASASGPAETRSILELSRARGMPERVLPVEYGKVPSPAAPTVARKARDASASRTFEEVVAKALGQAGYDVDHSLGSDHVGVALAVRDPDDPTRYALGILTDGSAYQGAASARQRERLIPQVLRRRGWRLHRVWALDWVRDPDAALTRLLQAVEQAAQLGASGSHREPEDEATSVRHWRGQISALFASVEPTPEAAAPVPPTMEGPPYAEADFRVSLDCTPDQAPATELLSVVTRIVDQEGPIHVDEVTRRLARVWGMERVGSRTQEAARWALQQAERDGELEREGRFVWSSRGLNFRPRSRRTVFSDTLRKPKMIPPLEIRLALGEIVEGHVGVRPTEASELLTRVLGFDRLGEELKEAFARQIQKMVDADELQLRDGKLYVA